LVGYGIAGSRVTGRVPCISRACRITASRCGLEHSRPYALWIIAFQVLQQESPQTIDKVTAVLQTHTWYANQWQARLPDAAICLALVIIGNENDVQKRERATNRVANK
jgi:hypothetical protein